MNFIDFVFLSISEMKRHLSFQYKENTLSEGEACLEWWCDGKIISEEIERYPNCSCSDDDYDLLCDTCGYAHQAHELSSADKRMQLEREFLSRRYYRNYDLECAIERRMRQEMARR